MKECKRHSIFYNGGTGYWYITLEKFCGNKKDTSRAINTIKAAPNMLEALENLENDDGAIPDHAWTMVKDAIAKAKGEEWHI